MRVHTLEGDFTRSYKRRIVALKCCGPCLDMLDQMCRRMGDLGDHIRAARLYGGARKLRRSISPISAAIYAPIFDGMVDVLMASMGKQSYEAEVASRLS